nr:hypothetical protein [Pseudomonas sp. BIGb0427]
MVIVEFDLDVLRVDTEFQDGLVQVIAVLLFEVAIVGAYRLGEMQGGEIFRTAAKQQQGKQDKQFAHGFELCALKVGRHRGIPVSPACECASAAPPFHWGRQS